MPTTSETDARLNVGVALALGVLCLLAWLYLLYLDSSAAAMAAVMPTTSAWTLADGMAMFVMWAMMMVAMMLPSVAAMVLIYDRTVRHRRSLGRTGAPTALFVAGYLLAWAGFSVLATVANWLLHRSGLLTSAMGTTPATLSAVLLLTAGAYQWSPLKDACLTHCRSPVGFLADHWREGHAGAIAMGLNHGIYCVGCCWLLMALLFVLGVMNLIWIAVLTLFVWLEKLAPGERLVSRVTGTALAGWGAWLLLTGA